jgi:hypothetical protein
MGVGVETVGGGECKKKTLLNGRTHRQQLERGGRFTLNMIGISPLHFHTTGRQPGHARAVETTKNRGAMSWGWWRWRKSGFG